MLLDLSSCSLFLKNDNDQWGLGLNQFATKVLGNNNIKE